MAVLIAERACAQASVHLRMANKPSVFPPIVHEESDFLASSLIYGRPEHIEIDIRGHGNRDAPLDNP